jgi:hypothetical protein
MLKYFFSAGSTPWVVTRWQICSQNDSDDSPSSGHGNGSGWRLVGTVTGKCYQATFAELSPRTLTPLPQTGLFSQVQLTTAGKMAIILMPAVVSMGRMMRASLVEVVASGLRTAGRYGSATPFVRSVPERTDPSSRQHATMCAKKQSWLSHLN